MDKNLYLGLSNPKKIVPMPVSTYSPALTREENERVEALVERLQSIQKVEDDLRKQIRKIIYKIEKPR